MSFLVEHLSGFEGRLNAQQAEVLAQLKERIAKSEYADDLAAHPDGDRWILRFLRASMKDKKGARLFQVEQAEGRLFKTCEFRRAHGLNEMTKLLVAGKEEEARPKEWDIYAKVFPFLTVNNTETGDVFLFNRLPVTFSHMNTEAMSLEAWARCVSFDSELQMQQMRVNAKTFGKEIPVFVSVCDASTMSLTGIASRRKMVQYVSDVAAEHFPETLAKTFICQIPWYFDKVWSMLKPFVDKETLAKICIKSGIPTAEIMEVIPKNLILKEFGGDNETVLPKCIFE